MLVATVRWFVGLSCQADSGEVCKQPQEERAEGACAIAFNVCRPEEQQDLGLHKQRFASAHAAITCSTAGNEFSDVESKHGGPRGEQQTARGTQSHSTAADFRP